METVAAARRERLWQALGEAGLDRLVVYGNAWQGDYLRYVTDFALLEGHGFALVERSGGVRFFVESAAEAERAAVEVPRLDVALVADAAAAVRAALDAAGTGPAGGAPFQLLPQRVAQPATGALVDATALVDRLLMRKLDGELAAIRRASALADAAYEVFRAAAAREPRQYELVAEVEAFLRAQGCADNFMLVGSGGVDVRGMVPPSERRLAAGDLVTTELTPEVEGYYAQICRTLVVGRASEAQRRAFGVFREALEAGIGAVRPGATAADVARAENDVFRAHGLGEYTTSSYTRVRGHGLGLFPDSKPHVLEDVEVALEPGMTVVVHPNTYHPEVGYIVLGDSCIVTAQGCEVLTRTPRTLFETAA